MLRIKQKDFFEKCRDIYGDDWRKYKLICPMCDTPQSAEDFMKAGVGIEDIPKYLGFSCIGRFTGKGTPTEKNKGNGCNWTLGGLFSLHKVEVIMGDGTVYPSFDIYNPEKDKEQNG